MGEEENKITVFVKENDIVAVVELLNFVKVNGRKNNKHMIVRACCIERNLTIIEKDEFNSAITNHEVFKIGQRNRR